MGTKTSRFKDIEKDPEIKALAKAEHTALCFWLDMNVGELNDYTITSWVYGYTQPEQSAVQHAVYHACDWKEWQAFRIALKKFNTQEKLLLLENYKLERKGGDLTDIRINNYIGALRRGGQLNDRMEIVK